MWSRKLILFYCCLVFLSFVHGQGFGNQGRPTGGSSQSRPGGESSFVQNNGGDDRLSGLQPDQSFGRPTGGLSQSRPGGDNLSGRPNEGSSFVQNNREGDNRPSSLQPDQSFGRPVGGSTQNRPNEGSSFVQNNSEGNDRPSLQPDQSFGRPTGGSSQSRPSGGSSFVPNNRGENRPSGFRPDTDDQSFGRPAGGFTQNRPNEGSSFVQNNREGDNRPSLQPDQSFGRPVGGSTQNRPNEGSSFVQNNREEDNQPSNFRPDTGDQSFGRPTGGQSRPNEGSSFVQNNREGENRPSGFRPDTNEKETDSITVESNNEEKDGSEVCFPNLGCFKMGKPWKSALRPVGAPHGPEKIQTTLQFYSRANMYEPLNITLYPQVNMGKVQFDPQKITVMIVHGFANSGNATWMKNMKSVYLRKVDANAIIVDWGKGAQLLNYFQVAGNTRVVGKQLALFVKYLQDNYGADPGKFHLIGHSLGAQICSYLSKDVPGIARLTALDPAQPAFEGFDAELRLDKTDAEFVDVIHTDARPFIPTLGFGMIAPHGHVDFYMNGGYDQPGCVTPAKSDIPSIKSFTDLAKFPVEVIAKIVACPHARAYEFLIEAFNETESCIFWGHKADVKNVFKSVTNTVTQGLLKKYIALSSTCSKEDCIPLGFATKKSPLRGVFVVTTNNKPPYCISEAGVPPETPPQEQKRESVIQKIGKKSGIFG